MCRKSLSASPNRAGVTDVQHSANHSLQWLDSGVYTVRLAHMKQQQTEFHDIHFTIHVRAFPECVFVVRAADVIFQVVKSSKCRTFLFLVAPSSWTDEGFVADVFGCHVSLKVVLP